MNLTRPSEVKTVLARLGVRPSRVWGQNFLIDANIRRLMLAEAEILPSEGVLEIGAGLGVLTEALLQAGARVVAVEKDRRLAAYLRERFVSNQKLDVIEADALDLDLDALLARGLTSVVSNLPYSVASRLLVELCEAEHAPSRMVVTVQSEVAERLAAAPDGADYGLLSILAQLRFTVDIRRSIRPTCFYPPPKVQSAIVALSRRPDPVPPAFHRERIKQLARAAFAHRRKQLATIFRQESQLIPPGMEAQDWLALACVPPHVRPAELTLNDWIRLAAVGIDSEKKETGADASVSSTAMRHSGARRLVDL